MEPGRDQRWHLGNLGPAGPSPMLVTTATELRNPTLPGYMPMPKARAAGQQSALWTWEDRPPRCLQVPPRGSVPAPPRALLHDSCVSSNLHAPNTPPGLPVCGLGASGLRAQGMGLSPPSPPGSWGEKAPKPQGPPLAKPCDFLPMAACPPQPGPPPTGTGLCPH